MTAGRPTRDGCWVGFAAAALGLAGISSGNNLVYLLCAVLLALMLVSFVLSELTLRGLRVRVVPPEEVYAGRPALVTATLVNVKRRLASYGVGLEVRDAGGVARRLHVPRLEPRGERLLAWETVLPRRGRHRLPALRIATRFPFGLFLKAVPVAVEGDVLVFPAVRPVAPGRLDEDAGAGSAASRRRGRGHDLYNLRDYRAGDDPRLIHWRSSAKIQALAVRELEDEAAVDVRLVLGGARRGDPAAWEDGLSEAASLAVHVLRRGAGVEVRGPGLAVGLGRGAGQERRILAALALCDPLAAPDPGPAPAAPGRREIHVDLGRRSG